MALPIITPHLTTTDYGVAGVVTAYVTALGMVQSLGLSVVMVNTFVKHPTRFKWVWRQVHGFVSLWSVVYTMVIVGVLYFGIPEAAVENRSLLIALNCLPLLLFATTEHQANLFFQLSQRPVFIALRSLAIGGVVVGLNIFTIAYLKLGYLGWFYASFAGAGVGFVLNFHSIYVKEQLWPIFRLRLKRVRSWLRVSLPVVPHQVSFFILDISDKLILSWLRVPLRQIGVYNVASNFGSYFMAASGAVVQASSPFYMRLLAQQDSASATQQVRRLTFSLQAMYLVATTLVCLWMREIFGVLIRNADLQQAYQLAIVIVMAQNFRPMYLAVVNLLTYRELTGRLWRISLVAALSNILLNFLLIPVLGYKVAAFTTFAAFMCMGYAGYFLKEYRTQMALRYYPGFWFILTIAALSFVYSFSGVSVELKTMLTAVLFGVSILGAALLQKKLKLTS
ncbi:lipopolysaccharide biosynthesis protein [Pontibacter mangrovi]|uniref:Lipopolysaccharide biosynthesis protein n=1 Tax=Pontibacter mangrovi TaxID=2589816 RepID=A0A501W532_9BACT|nr:hypothetical protein [Pontibacter mangrovi]TPE44709.1 hypothetical protein FJM65_06700 [Pontibacter mangrovi]